MKIAFTGGGTAGHAIANTILIPRLQAQDCNIIYIGSEQGREKELAAELGDVKYYGVSTGKWRRDFSMKNIKDIFSVMKGFFEAYGILKSERPQLLYSGGGYVSVPVVLAARRLGIPVFIRETDRSVGLANSICMPFAEKVYSAFPDTRIGGGRTAEFAGILVRPELLDVGPRRVKDAANDKPRCLILGGSMGSVSINNVVRENIEKLTKRYDIVHICGEGNVDGGISCEGNYRQLEYVHKGMGALMAAADVVVTRCGSNAILETLALGKRTVCIPISARSSRGEQILNAEFAAAHGNAVVLGEGELNGNRLLQAMDEALALNGRAPFKVDICGLEHGIDAQVKDIIQRASQKMTDDFIASLRGAVRINFQELSGVELEMYDEVVTAYGGE